MSSPELTTAGARTALEAGDSRQALTCLRWQCRAPGFHEDADSFGGAIGILAQLCRHFDDHELAQLAAGVEKEPSDAQALYELGWALVERELYAIAAAVLARANILAPDEPAVLSELAVALEAEGRSDAAIAVLEASPSSLASNFPCRYLLAVNAVLAGDLQKARAAAAAQCPEDDEERRAARNVERMIVRADGIAAVTPLDRKDLRGWHFVTTGGLLLHLSPFGYDEGMCGRYAFTSDSYERIRYSIARLESSLAALGYRPSRVIAPADRASQAVSVAISQLWGVPLAPLDEGPGLIVTYDLQGLSEEDATTVATRHPGQMLFAHATCWTGLSLVPDVTGLLYQVNVAPWDEQTRFAGPGQEASRAPADDSPAEALAQRIITAATSWSEESAPRDTDDDLRSLCEAARPLFVTRDEGEPRAILPRGGGPVKSSRFE